MITSKMRTLNMGEILTSFPKMETEIKLGYHMHFKNIQPFEVPLFLQITL